MHEGDSTKFLWVKTIELFWLNDRTSTLVEFHKFISWVNKKFCEPDLPFQEMVKIVDSLWNQYHQGEIKFDNYQKKKHSFWSPKCTLSANEKRKITCKLNNAAKMEKNIKIIHDVIEDLYSDGLKITQKIVAETTGIGISTIKQKKY